MTSRIGRGHLGAEEEFTRLLRDNPLQVFDDYTVSNPTALRTFNPTTVTLAELAQVVATMIADMQKRGTTRTE